MAGLSGLGPPSIKRSTTLHQTHKKNHRKNTKYKELPASQQTGTPAPHRPQILVFLRSKPLQPLMEFCLELFMSEANSVWLSNKGNQKYGQFLISRLEEKYPFIIIPAEADCFYDNTKLSEFLRFIYTCSTKQRLAFYSPSAAERFGTKIYKTPDGSAVEVTGVMEGLEDTGSYKWPDKVPVIVTSYLRDGREGYWE